MLLRNYLQFLSMHFIVFSSIFIFFSYFRANFYTELRRYSYVMTIKKLMQISPQQEPITGNVWPRQRIGLNVSSF